jgi:hypothetical protein
MRRTNLLSSEFIENVIWTDLLSLVYENHHGGFVLSWVTGQLVQIVQNIHDAQVCRRKAKKVRQDDNAFIVGIADELIEENKHLLPCIGSKRRDRTGLDIG